jgi:hypothetical protein
VTTIRRRIEALLGSIVQALSGERRPWRSGRPSVLAQRRPVRHEGATERFGSELRALRTIDVSPELVTDIETELRWGLIWHDFERDMQTEIDRVFAPYLPVPDVHDFDEVRELVGLRQLVAA